MRLSKSDWNRLDELLGKVGFGGYYDLIEVLKDTARNLKPDLSDKIRKEDDLHTLVTLIYRLSEQK